MTKHILLLLTFFFAWQKLDAQIPAPTFRWAQPLSNASDLSCMKVSPAGNVYVSGAFKQGGVCFDTTYSHCQNAIGEGGDAFLAKYNREGVLQWAKLLGSKSNDNSWGLEFDIDEQENIYFLGHSSQDSLYIGDSLFFHGYPKIYHNQWFNYLVKFDTKGEIQWLDFWKGLFFNKITYKHRHLYLVGNYFTQNHSYYNTGIIDNEHQIGNKTIVTPLQNEPHGLIFAQISPKNELLSHRLLPFHKDFNHPYVHTLAVLSDATMLLHGAFQDSIVLEDTTFRIGNTFPNTNPSDNFLLALDNDYHYKWGETYVEGMNIGYIQIYPQEKGFLFCTGINYTSKQILFGDSVNGDYLYKSVLFQVNSNKKVQWKKEGKNAFLAAYLNNSSYGVGYTPLDTVNYFGCPIPLNEIDKWSIFYRIDDSCKVAWQRKVFKYGDFLDRGVGITDIDKEGYLYGQGNMRQFSTYLDSILVQPLAFTMEKELFIFSMTKDSFPPKVIPPPPPPVDTITAVWQVFPNPFEEELYLTGKFSEPVITLHFWDILGRKVSSQFIEVAVNEGIKQKIATDKLSSGLYFLEIVNGKQKQQKKLWRQ
ncbi:MAG: T9SS type A sorting domain-containing protein [Bacteroidia bacterium]